MPANEPPSDSDQPFDDEAVFWRGSRGLSDALPYVAFGVLLSAAGVILWLVTDLPLDWVPLILVPTGFMYGSAFVLDCSSVTYSLTAEHLRRESALVVRSVEEVALDRVHDVSTERSLIDHLFDTGRVVVTLGPQYRDPFVLKGVDDPERVAGLVADRSGTSEGDSGTEGDLGADSTRDSEDGAPAWNPITFGEPSTADDAPPDPADDIVDPPLDVLRSVEPTSSGGSGTLSQPAESTEE